MATEPPLEVRDLKVTFPTEDGFRSLLVTFPDWSCSGTPHMPRHTYASLLLKR